ncbi:MAG: hypothetical protein J0J00_04985 [Microbacterium sp.]|nr:hypothetical protein [Microbacterium sp.]
MQISGILPEDAPDPRIELEGRIRQFPFPVLGLVPQPAVQDLGGIGITDAWDAEGRESISVSVTYTYWRNPADHADPVNLAELDDETRASLDTVPPWPRPAWIVEMAEQLRHPMLWEAVRTTWRRARADRDSLSRSLVDHVNHILQNRFRSELGIAFDRPFDRGWEASVSSVDPTAELEIDGVQVPAVQIDTDPFVYAVGALTGAGTVATVVIPRDHLAGVRLALQARGGPTGS